MGTIYEHFKAMLHLINPSFSLFAPKVMSSGKLRVGLFPVMSTLCFKLANVKDSSVRAGGFGHTMS